MKDILKMIEYLRRDGVKDEEIRKRLNISKRKFSKLKHEKPELFLPDITSYQVEDALLKRALGFSYSEVREVEKSSGTEVTTTYKEVPPDVSAATIWLKSRKGEVWNEKHTEENGLDKVNKLIEQLDEKATKSFGTGKGK